MPGKVETAAVNGNTSAPVVTSVEAVPVTGQRKPFIQPEGDEGLVHIGRVLIDSACPELAKDY